MTNEEREKKIRNQPIPTKEECLAFYNELTKLADVRFVPYYKMAIKALEDKGYEQGYKEGYVKGHEEGVVLG
jgi:hypothetical protein